MYGEFLKCMRVASGYTQTELADKLGIAQNTLSNYETNIREAQLKLVKQISDICEFEIIFKDKNSDENFILNNKGKIKTF